MYIKDKDGNYVPTPSSKGADGREVSLRVANNYIQWRYPDTEWTNLVPLSSLKGEPGTDGIDGREVHMRVVSDTLQWRLGDSGTWQTLMSLSTVTDGAAFGGMVVDKTLVLAEMEAGGGSGGTADAVTYTPQTLTAEQKLQARTNIGAEKAGTAYTKPASGIPKSDLAEDVQTSLTKADTAISLGLTSTTPGQIIKVKTVQDGKPTAWEAVDLPGGDYEFVQSFKLSPDVAYYELASVAEYKSIRINVIRGTQDNALGNGNLFLRVGYAGNVVGSAVNLFLMITGFKSSFYFGEAHADREYAWGSLFYGNNRNTLTTGIGFGVFEAVDNKYNEILENIGQCVYSLLYAKPAETIDGQETVYVYGVRR